MRTIAILVMALTVTACGGSDGGTNSAGTTPPPTPQSPTEVARQTPVNASFNALNAPEKFNTIASTITLTGNANGTVSNISSTQAGFKSDVTIAYDPTNQSYTLSTNRGAINNQTSFSSADLVQNVNGVAQYSKTISGTEESQLLLTRAGALQYTSLGAWTNVRRSTSANTIDAAFFAFGQETAVTAMPKTGSASYALVVAGLARNGSTLSAIGGTGTASVDFGASRLTTTLNAGLYDGNGNLASTQTLNGSATIASNFARFSGTLQGDFSGTAVTGPINGAFFGPAAEEIGGSFKVSGGQVEAVGAFVGAQ